MGRLIYVANTSLDGYVENPAGGISWGTPDEEYFGVVNELQRSAGVYLYGRRMYESMAYWETAPLTGQPHWVVDFTRIWRAADKVVFSRTLSAVSSARTTLERRFDAGAVQRMKAAATHDLTVGGADLAAQAIGAGLVDELHLFVWPLVLGGGKPAFPGGARLGLDLRDADRLASGITHLRYDVTRS